MKKKTLISLLCIAAVYGALSLYNRRLQAVDGTNASEDTSTSGYTVACLKQGKPGDALIRKKVGYHLALSDRASNRCFYKFNNAFSGKKNGKDKPIDFEKYDIITVSIRSPLFKPLKNNPHYLWKALNYPWVTFTQADGPYAHLLTPTQGGKRHILLEPSGPLVDNWNEVCSILGGNAKACYP